MIIVCPHCHKQHRLLEGVVPPAKSAAHCKGCGRRFIIDSPMPAPGRTRGQADAQGKSSAPQPVTAAEVTALSPPPVADDPADHAAATAALTESFPDLAELPPEYFALPNIFTPDQRGNYRGSLNSHKAKLLQATAPLLIDRLLANGETVQRIASGIAYFRFEIPYANGLLTWPLNYYALVATNQRLLMINLDHRLTRPDRYVFQIPLAAIAEVSRGLYGTSLIIKTGEGQGWDFTTVKRALAKEMTAFIRERQGTDDQARPEIDYYPQLCPVCFQPVPERIASCPHCLTTYKSSSDASKKSLLLPGLGVIYLSFNSLGIAEMVGYLFTWLLTVILVIIGIPGGILGGGLLVLAYHLMSAFMAGQMAHKGYIPEQQPQDEEFSNQT